MKKVIRNPITGMVEKFFQAEDLAILNGTTPKPYTRVHRYPNEPITVLDAPTGVEFILSDGVKYHVYIQDGKLVVHGTGSNFTQPFNITPESSNLIHIA